MSLPQGLGAGPASALPLYAVGESGLAALLERVSPAQAGFLRAQQFTTAAGRLQLVPGEDGIAGAVFGLGREDSLFTFGSLPGALPPGSFWRLETGSFDYDNATLGFLLGAYGYAEGFAMERYVRDVLVMPIWGGSSLIQKNNIANLMRLPRK